MPLENIKKTAFGSLALRITPGNCSGSYIERGNCLATSSKSICPPRSTEATIFCTLQIALFLILTPPFFSSFTTLLIAITAISSEREPVQTIFPVLNIKVEVFGNFIRYTNPGNRSGLYSVFSKVVSICIKSILCLKSPVATTFSTLITGLVLGKTLSI